MENIKDILDSCKNLRPEGEVRTNLKLEALLMHNNLSDLFCKQSIKLFSDKCFIYKDSEDYYWGFKVFYKDGGKKLTIMKYNLFRIKTSKGSIYVSAIMDKNNKLSYNFYTAHLLDRIKERLNLKNREAACRRLISERLNSTHLINNSIIFTPGIIYKEYNNVFTPIKSGMIMGDYVTFEEKEYVFFKTFVNNELVMTNGKNREELNILRQIYNRLK